MPEQIDPRPKDRNLWIEKYRKVQPPANKASAPEASARGSNAHARRAPINSGIHPYTGVWSEKEISHLLRRCLFGVTKNNLSEFKALTLEDSVDRLLVSSPTPASPVNDYSVDNDTADPDADLGESWLAAPHAGDKEGLRIISLKAWHIRNMIAQEATLHEKMIFFWHNLLPTLSWDVYIGKTSFAYGEMLRKNALGNYRTLIRELTLDPAMLIFLNGTSNKKEAPDENYGRELQELFCIGKGPDSKYTEGDVQAAARVLTGWEVTWEKYSESGPFGSHFNSNAHDSADKQFSSFYGNKVISGKTGEAGATELDELLEMIIGHEETSRYICRRLYNFFVYSEIDSATEENVIKPLAQIFRDNNYEIKPVVKTLLMSTHFFDVANRGAMIKSPLDHLIGLWRTLGMKTSDPDDIVLQHTIHSSMLWHMASLGLEVSDPPNVAGWPAYYQAPQYDKSWITTNTITTRAITSDSMIFWGFWISADLQMTADLLAFAKTLELPEDPVSLIQESMMLLCGFEATENDLNNLKTVLLSGLESDIYWTIAWNAYVNNPGNDEYKLIVENRLKATFQRMLQSGEYQLM